MKVSYTQMVMFVPISVTVRAFQYHCSICIYKLQFTKEGFITLLLT